MQSFKRTKVVVLCRNLPYRIPITIGTQSHHNSNEDGWRKTMLSKNKIASVTHLERRRRATEYEAMRAIIIMKDRPEAFIHEPDDDLTYYLQMQLRWVVLRLPSYWLARYRGKKIYPRYENVAPLVTALVAAAQYAHPSEGDRAEALILEQPP
jgi:hypothetical protein